MYLNLQSKIGQRDSRSQGKAKQNFRASEDSYTTGHLTNVQGNENALYTMNTSEVSSNFVPKKLVITKISVVLPFLI